MQEAPIRRLDCESECVRFSFRNTGVVTDSIPLTPAERAILSNEVGIRGNLKVAGPDVPRDATGLERWGAVAETEVCHRIPDLFAP
jgi:hypothetical protein